MSSDVFELYDDLQARFRVAMGRVMDLEMELDRARKEEEALGYQLDALRDETNRAVKMAEKPPPREPEPKKVHSEATTLPSPRSKAATLPSVATYSETAPVAEPAEPEVPAPPGIRSSVWELVLSLPLDDSVGMDQLRQTFNELQDGAISSRVRNAKNAGLVESGGWGQYQLTAKGQELRGQRLRLVNDDN